MKNVLICESICSAVGSLGGHYMDVLGGATGVRILAALVREMRRCEARYRLRTMCIGGEQRLAATFERVA